MPDQPPQNAEKPDDAGRGQSMRRRRWVYLIVKIVVLLVVLFSLVGVNVVGIAEKGSIGGWRLSHGWPFEYAEDSDFMIFGGLRGDILAKLRPRCLFAYEPPDQVYPVLLFLDITVAVTILCYLSHVITVVHRRWKPAYRQYSLRVLLTLPVLLAVIMALAHYDLLTWRRAFLVVVWTAVLACLACLVAEVWGLVTKRKKPDA